MANTLDAFKAQLKAAETLHAKLTEVASLVSALHSQLDGLRVDQQLKETLDAESKWLTHVRELVADVRAFRHVEYRRVRVSLLWRWAMPFGFALACSASMGGGLLWAWQPYAAELTRLRAQAQFAELVESRVAAMTTVERQEFERLMKLSQSERH
jgi:hypothetical protein